MSNKSRARGREASAGRVVTHTLSDIRGLHPEPRRPVVKLCGQLSRLFEVDEWKATEQLPAWVHEVARGYLVHGIFRVNGRRYFLAICVQEGEPDEWYVQDFCAAESLDGEMVLAFGDVMATMTDEEKRAVLDVVGWELNRHQGVRQDDRSVNDG